jgi:putative SOS response-associated peptidase YedK
MCGRFTLAAPADDLVETFDVHSLTFDYFPRFNIAPGQACPVVAQDGGGRRMGLLEWGFIPSWKREPSGAFINARAESVATKPSFREAFRRRRCLVPADGFFEWRRGAPKDGPRRQSDRSGRSRAHGKTPFWIYPTGGGLVSFAGIWETWRPDGAEPRHTFAIITTGANEDVIDVHDRMPVVIGSHDRATWLDQASPQAEVVALLGSPPRGAFACRAVTDRVNDVAQDDPSLIEARGE